MTEQLETSFKESMELDATPGGNEKLEDGEEVQRELENGEEVQYSRCLRLLGELDFYEELGIPRTANENRIRSAFHKLSQRWHPEMYVPVRRGNKTPVRTQLAAATEKFYCLTWMYEVLKDPELRRIYDQHGYGGVYKSETYQETSVFDLDPYDIFDGFWNGATEADREYLLLHGPDGGSDDEGDDMGSNSREAIRSSKAERMKVDEEEEDEDLEELLSSVDTSQKLAQSMIDEAKNLTMPRPPGSLMMSSNMYKGPGNVGMIRNPIDHDVWKDLTEELAKNPPSQD